MDAKQRVMALALSERDAAELLAAQMLDGVLNGGPFKPWLEAAMRGRGASPETLARLIADVARARGGQSDAVALVELANVCAKWGLTWADVDQGRARVACYDAEKARAG
jgi:hypothetical protein